MEDNSLSFVVSEGRVGMRADKYLSDVCDDLSRSRLQGLIAEGQVLFNGRILKTPAIKVKEGDKFRVSIPAPAPSIPVAENIDLDVIFEDDDLLVINKQAGMVVHPGAGNWSGTLVNALLYYCGDSLSGIGGVVRPGIVHRLDKDTSGLMMVAKNDHAHQLLSQQLADRSLSRIYHAMVFDVPLPIKGSIDRPIGRHRHNRLKMSVVSNALRDAKTHYKVIKNYNDAISLIECRLESGRTHQIRVHMDALGHPVLGDTTYGVQQTALIAKMKNGGYHNDLIREFIEFPRQMLHARRIEFIHPSTEEKMVFECEFPDDIIELLEKLI